MILSINSGEAGHRAWLPLTLLMALCPAWAAADERSSALTSNFQYFCTQALPDFERLDNTARKLNLAVQRETPPSLSVLEQIHSKAWAVSDNTGPYELAAAEGFRGVTRVEGCGIGASDVKGEEVRRDLAKAMNLGEPVREVVGSDGKSKEVYWQTKMGEDDVTVLLSYAYPEGSGMYLNLLQERNSTP